MRVLKAKLINVMGVEELEFDVGPPGTITIIAGGNEAGKTSTLEGLRAVLRGGTTADLLRNGADSGEAVLVFDDGVEARQAIGTAGGLEVRSERFGAIKAPRTWMDRLVGALNANPLEFTQEGAEGRQRRVQRLLEVLPLRVTQEEIEAAAGGLNVGGVDPEAHALVEIDRIHQRIYDARTELNADVRAKSALIDQLAATLPKEQPGDTSTERTALEAERKRIAREAATAETSAREAVRTRQEQIRDEAGDRVAAVMRAIEELQAKARAFRDEAEAEVGKLELALRDEIQLHHAAMATEMNRVEVRLAELGQIEKAAAAAEQTRKIIAAAAGQHAESLEKAQRADAALKGLADLKIRKVNEESPIPGIEVRETNRKGEREVFVNGVVWTRLNTARKYEIAVQIAAMAAGDLPFMCVDGAEALDATSFKALAAAVEKYGVQLVTARTTPEREALHVFTREES